MVILVDMDDTIEHLLKAWVNTLNERYNYSVDWTKITKWDTLAAFPGLTSEQVYGTLEEDDFWNKVEPIKGAKETLEYFINKGHKIVIVTAASYKSIYGKMEYCLFKNFPFLSWKDVVITSQKQLLKGDILIDDGVHNHEGGDYISILVDAGYNRDYDEKKNGMIRVYNWDEIKDIVDKISIEKGEV